MKLQPASKKELIRILVGTLICAGIMLAVFVILALCGIIKLDYSVFLGALGGCAIAVLNFALMCQTVQSATADSDEKRRRARIRTSYQLRLLGQALWCVLTLLVVWLQPVAAILPLLFPRIVIYYLQITGKFKTPPQK